MIVKKEIIEFILIFENIEKSFLFIINNYSNFNIILLLNHKRMN